MQTCFVGSYFYNLVGSGNNYMQVLLSDDLLNILTRWYFYCKNRLFHTKIGYRHGISTCLSQGTCVFLRSSGVSLFGGHFRALRRGDNHPLAFWKTDPGARTPPPPDQEQCRETGN